MELTLRVRLLADQLIGERVHVAGSVIDVAAERAKALLAAHLAEPASEQNDEAHSAVDQAATKRQKKSPTT